ncbi:MAG: ankyrin repeat domain-containing protein [Campylobacterota bacterium]|nr:ankyrin repeat domain-containing protein [Campylobacterota bacterium]
MLGIFRSLLKKDNYKNEKYYKAIKKLTELLIKVEKKDDDIYFQKTINDIRVTVWIKKQLTTINIKIVESSDYELSLNFDNNNYVFSKTNYDNKDSIELDIVYLNYFEENIEIIFLDIIDKVIEYYSNKLVGEQDKNNKEKIINLASSIKKENIQEKEVEVQKEVTLFDAVESLNITLVRKLINNGANINQKNKDGDTALMVAVMMNTSKREAYKQKKSLSHYDKDLINIQYSIIKLLLENEADVYQKNKYDYNVLEIIKEKSHHKKISSIFEKYEFLDVVNHVTYSDDEIFSAINTKNIKQIKAILKSGKDFNCKNTNGNTALMVAVAYGYNDVVAVLLSNGVDVNVKNKYGKTALDIAIKHKMTKIIKIFKEYGHDSVKKENIKIKKAESNKTISVKVQKEVTLFDAVESLNITLVKKLINNGADINQQNKDGDTALMVAVSSNLDWNIIEVLLLNQASTNIKNNDGVGVLDILHNNNDQHTILLMKKYNYNTENRDKEVHKSKVDEEYNTQIEELKLKVNNFEEKTIFQSNEIKKLQNEMIFKEEKNTKIIEELNQKSINFDNKINNEIKNIKLIDESKINSRFEELEIKLNNHKDLENSIEIKLFNKLKSYMDNNKSKIKSLENNLLSQSNEIKELQNKLILKEEDTKKLINGFTDRINKLEKKFEKQKAVKTKIPLDIHIENKSIKKDDGVIVKRESFDDF